VPGPIFLGLCPTKPDGNTVDRACQHSHVEKRLPGGRPEWLVTPNRTSTALRFRSDEFNEFLSTRQLALLPEIQLALAADVYPLWKATEAVVGTALGLPYWAFAWSGGQALARYILDTPEEFRDQTVVDLGAGSGMVGIAAALVGASLVFACDPDEFARYAIDRNASLNGVVIKTVATVREVDGPVDTIVTGDVFYDRDMSAAIELELNSHIDSGVRVIVGDPGRSFLPANRLEVLAEYEVPVMAEIEEEGIKLCRVYRFC
jgi:predicted nicotinamide N-methyase